MSIRLLLNFLISLTLLYFKIGECFEIDFDSKRITNTNKRAIMTTSSYEIEEIYLNVEFENLILYKIENETLVEEKIKFNFNGRRFLTAIFSKIYKNYILSITDLGNILLLKIDY
jgi:hypothetical protein